MTTREKVIVGATGVILAWGAFAFIQGNGDSAQKDKSAGSTGVGADAFVANSRARLASHQVSASELDVLMAATQPWTRGFFKEIESTEEDPSGDVSGGRQPRVVRYHALIQTEAVTFAILNNREYQRGDRVIGTESIVDEIKPAYIVLVDEQSGEREIVPREQMNLKGE